MKIQNLDTPLVCSNAVTTSTAGILPPANLQNYSAGTNGRHEPAKDTRFAWMAENFRRKDVSPLARCVLGWMVTAAQWREDRLMIIGKGEIAERMGIGKRTADRCILELIAAGCFRLVSKGGSLRGQSREANTYALGTAFEGTPPPLRPRRRGTPLRPVSPVTLVPTARPVSSVTADQCQELHPLPIVPPIHTHTKDSPSAFNKESWMAYTENPALFPGWTREDRERCFDLAKRKGYETDETWRGCCAFYFKQWQRHNGKPQAPAAAIAQRHFTPAPRPAVRSSCESPRVYVPFDGLPPEEWHAKANGYYGLGGRDEWVDLGCPHLAGRSKAERDSAIAAAYAKKGLGVKT